jgi:hypothetical protein
MTIFNHNFLVQDCRAFDSLQSFIHTHASNLGTLYPLFGFIIFGDRFVISFPPFDNEVYFVVVVARN